MIPRAVSRTGRSLKPAHFALYYAQRLVTLPTLRTATANVIASAVNSRHPRSTAALSKQSIAAVQTLRSQGCTEVPALLSPTKLAAINKYLSGIDAMVGDKAYRDAPTSLPPGVTADYPIESLLACDELVEVANHPLAIEVASAYLGCAPTISTMTARWSMPEVESAQITQKFHRDYDDWRFLKLFIYLSDVDLETGPHTYVLGSHRQSARFLARPYPDKEIEQTCGEAGLKRFVGPGGSAFFCDTYGIHKGALPLKRPRLMFLVQYSILPVYAYDYIPPIHSDRPVDPYTNRLFLLAGKAKNAPAQAQLFQES